MYSLVEKVSPCIPYIGLASGGLTTAKHVYNHKSKPADSEPNVEDNQPETAE